jgi:hypothetical protein
MTLPADKKLQLVDFSDCSGGVNLVDPAISLPDSQCADALNLKFKKRGFSRHMGCENLTAKDACTDYLRGLFAHETVSGTDYLYTAFGGKLYSISKTTGALTELYDLTGTEEFWAGSHFGTFYAANGASVIKVEGTTASPVGIVAPSGTTAAGATSGGSLADGTYGIYVCYSRKISGLNVLFSKGQLVSSVTISGGGGNGKITFSNFANSSDGQVNNKVVFMTDADGSTFYQYHETDNNTTTSFDITSDSAKNNSITYTAFASTNDRPGNLTFLFAFDNRLWGVINNVLYYSLKSAPNSTYNLERWPALNKIEYPYRITGLFSIGKHLCINTAGNGIIIQPNADVTARYEHIETRESFKYMRTVADWRGGKIGLTNDKVGFFSGETFQFEEWDYGVNIRPILKEIWAAPSTNFQPVGITLRREDRIEYALSLRDTRVNLTNNNRTYVLNLSRTMFVNRDQYRAPWEIVGRGFNYACVDDDNTAYFGQSFNGSSTIYKELTTATTEVGIYSDTGTYLDEAANMPALWQSRTVLKNLFAKQIIETVRKLISIKADLSVGIFIADDQSRSATQEMTVQEAGLNQSVWDTMLWGDNWSSEGDQMAEVKAYDGEFGYTWYLRLEQTANDVEFNVSIINVLVTNETGRGI